MEGENKKAPGAAAWSEVYANKANAYAGQGLPMGVSLCGCMRRP